MKAQKRKIRRFTLHKIREGWSKQQIFEHLWNDLDEEVRRDYRLLKKFTHYIASVPRLEVRKNLRLLKGLLVVLLLSSSVAGFLSTLPLTIMYGIPELPLYGLLLWMIAWNFFGLVNLLLILPALRYHVRAFLLLGILNAFLFFRDVWVWYQNPGDSLLLNAFLIFCHFFSSLIAWRLYLRTPDAFALTRAGEGLWTAGFHKAQKSG